MIIISVLGKRTLPFALVWLAVLGLTARAARQEAPPQVLRVAGSVIDRNRAPVASAEVVLRAGAAEAGRVHTDEVGRFFFEVVGARVTSLVVRGRGFARYERAFESPGADGMAELEIVLDPAPLEEEVTVTAAARAETRLSDTAASVVVLSDEELSSTAALTIDDALRQVAGFQLFRRSGSRTANPTTQGVSLRGTGASGASRALVLMDGVPVNDPFGGWVYWSRVPREAVASVEVVRGGASGLYGGSALGGVVQINTRRISTSPILSLELSYGSQRTPDASLFAAVTRGHWGASLAAEAFSTDGYRIVDERERGPVDTPAGGRHATLDLTLERRFEASGRVFARGLYFAESRRNGTPLQTNDTRFRQLIAGADWQFAPLGAITLRAYGGTQVYGQSFTAVATDRNSEMLTRLQRAPAQAFGLTSQWMRSVGASHTLVAGMDARWVRGASDETIYARGRPASLVGAGGRERTLGVFAEDIFRAHGRAILTFGARFDRWRNYAAQSVTRPVDPTRPAAVQIFSDRTETAFSPQASLLYKPHAAVSLSASAYRSFRQPTLNELYRSFRVGDVLTLANERLQAERLTGGEAGLRFARPGGRLGGRANFFWLEITRPVSNVTLGVTPTLITRQRQNLGRTRSRGLELEAEGRPAQRLILSGGYLFADSTVLRFPANVALEGLRLPQTPRHQLTWQARYDGARRGWTLGYQGRLVGAQFDDDQNSFRLDGFATHDAFASLRVARGLEAFVAVENLFDRRYEVGRTPLTTIGLARAARVGIRLRRGER